MTTLVQFIQEKKNNFTNFLINLADPNRKDIKESIKILNETTPEKFILYVKNYLIPNKVNLDMTAKNFCINFNVDPLSIKEEDFKKIVAYLEMFCDVCSNV